jgi:hypothetical protein
VQFALSAHSSFGMCIGCELWPLRVACRPVYRGKPVRPNATQMRFRDQQRNCRVLLLESRASSAAGWTPTTIQLVVRSHALHHRTRSP